jgi:hypothetical protein
VVSFPSARTYPRRRRPSTGAPSGRSDEKLGPFPWAAGLLVSGGGPDGGVGAYFANAGEGVHLVGSLAPIAEGYISCIVIRPDRTRVLARAVPDPLVQQQSD